MAKINPNGEIYRWYVGYVNPWELLDNLTHIVFKYQNANIFHYIGDFLGDSEEEVIVVVGAPNITAAAYVIVQEIIDLRKIDSIEKELEVKQGFSPLLVREILIATIQHDLSRGIGCEDPLEGTEYERDLERELEHRLEMELEAYNALGGLQWGDWGEYIERRGMVDEPYNDDELGEMEEEYIERPYNDDELAEIYEELNYFSKPVEMALEEELSKENHYSYIFDEPQEEKIENGVLSTTPISQIQSGNGYLIIGIIMGVKSLFIRTICVQCFKNANDCSCQDSGTKKEILIIHLEIADDTGKIDCLFLGSVAEKLVQTKIELIKKTIDTPDFTRFLEKIESELIGKDIYVKGKVEFSGNRLIILIKGFRSVDIAEELNAALKKIDL